MLCKTRLKGSLPTEPLIRTVELDHTDAYPPRDRRISVVGPRICGGRDRDTVFNEGAPGRVPPSRMEVLKL